MPHDAPVFYPTLIYRDPIAALGWLARAFDFKVLADYRAPDGTLAHAEMSFGPGVIFIGSARPERGWMSPLDLPAINQVLCVGLEDPDAHHARARAAGAEITQEPKDTDYGSREYAAKDLEGHLWYFGTYRPKASD
jgi:uncharacterized glyoxalase superfamily protein PhnB